MRYTNPRFSYFFTIIKFNANGELVESLLLCSVEFDLLQAIDNDTVYRKGSLKSSEFRKLLNQSINQSIKTHLYSAMCRKRIRGVCMYS